MLAVLLAQGFPNDRPITQEQLAHPLMIPLDPKAWPPSCRRLRQENNRCDTKGCDQRLVDRLRDQCAKDEPHGE